MNRRSTIAALAALAVAAGVLRAQSYDELTFLRDRPSPYASVIQLQAGVLAGFASSSDEDIGLEDEIGWDAHGYLKQDRFGDRDAVLEAYAGRDGAYFGVLEGGLLGQETQSRLELQMRYFPFYREGFYRSDDFVPTGRYEGMDWGVSLSVAKEVAESLRFEAGPFYRHYSFDRNSDTAPNFIVPDNYNAWGARAFLEHNTVVLDRVTGRPDHGFIATVGIEREQNDSDQTFGEVGVSESRLPSGVWRGRGHLEWYLPQSKTGTWEIEVDGAITDKEDRVYIYDAQKPIGHIWVDANLRFRFELDLSLWVSPYLKGQFIKILSEDTVTSDQEFFFGGGLAAGYQIGDEIEALLDYSYLSNESREPVSASKDTFGEHQLFVGLQVRFGAARKF